MIKIRDGLCFDDVMLIPKYSDVSSRKLVDLSVDLGKGIKLEIPIISANMSNVTGVDMAIALANLGGLPILHRFYPTAEEQISNFKLVKKSVELVGCSVGVQADDVSLTDALVDNGCKILCVDIAHGDSAHGSKMTEYIAKKYPEVLLISGNVATHWGAVTLHNAGADVIKVGVGGGSLCTTRIETGNGVPQLTALDDVYGYSREVETIRVVTPKSGHDEMRFTGKRRFKVIADGGIRRAGDIVKALCFADTVMLGNLLAGTDEAPGNIITIDGLPYKEYAGSSTHKTGHVEGVAALVRCKGSVAGVIRSLLEGVRSGLSYQGAHNLEELRKFPEFVSISNAGLTESHPHDVKLNK